MKNYEQMAEDVLRRAEAYALQQKQNRRIIAGAAAAFGCLCLLIAAGIGGVRELRDEVSLEQPPAQVTVGSGVTEDSAATREEVSRTYGFTLLAAYTAEDAGTPLEENLKLPLNYSLRVRDLRGLTHAKAEAAVEEERETFRGKINQSGMTLGSCLRRDNYVISLVRIGSFRLCIEDYSVVQSISVRSTTDNGWIDIALSDGTFPKGAEVTLTTDQIPERDRELWLVINWKYSKAVLEALDADPATPLSEFSDTVIFTVNYTDGTAQECEVRILVQDDGQIVACLQADDHNV